MRIALALVVFAFGAQAAPADEGLWTFDQLPVKQIQERYGFDLSAERAERLRLAPVRLRRGTGVFVSEEGLIATNHHLVLECVQQLSSPDRDYVETGFLASTRQDELPCPSDEAAVLRAIRDVTDAVQRAVHGLTGGEAAEARRQVQKKLETSCGTERGVHCDLVELHGGGLYHLYEYRTYQDVRLVFSPERQAAYFGGTADNFSYPAYSLDVAFLRAYDQGQPVRPLAHLAWSAAAPEAGALVLVSGNPGRSARLAIAAELRSERDVVLPARLGYLRARQAALTAFAASGAEPARLAAAELFLLENSRTALEGRLAALVARGVLARRQEEEEELRRRVAAQPGLVDVGSDPWTRLAEIRRRADAREAERHALDFSASAAFELGGGLSMLALERAKPESERLPEYAETHILDLRHRLTAPVPIQPPLEEVLLASHLSRALETLGREHPFVKAALQGATPREAARAALAGTRLVDPAFRQRLFTGAVASDERQADTMLRLTDRLAPLVLAHRAWRADEIEAPSAHAGRTLAQARFAVAGREVPPDATFNLRLSFGRVDGYRSGKTVVPAFTTFPGLFERAKKKGNRGPWRLPERYLARRAVLDPNVPLNFVATLDVTGGHSGSPVVDREGRVVGLVFDGNRESLGLVYAYDDVRARAVCVASSAVLEALRKLYDADGLVAELVPETRQPGIR